MLILERRSGESIHINDDIKLTIYYNKGKQIKFGIEAPRHVSIIREELLNSVKKNKDSVETIQAESKTSQMSQATIRSKRKKRIILPET